MLAILLLASESGKGLSAASYGNNFITAFPENLAYFYPSPLSNNLRITALYNNTNIKIIYRSSEKQIQIQNSGQSRTVQLPVSAEVTDLGQSDSSVRVTSDQNITVVSMSLRATSFQVNVIQPTSNLGKNYLIPSLDYKEYLQTFNLVQYDVTPERYSSFKLIIINALGVSNNITITRQSSSSANQQEPLVEENISIDGFQLVQIQSNSSILKVTATGEIAVILTHPCLEIINCNCKMLMNQILPAKFEGQNFIVPSIFNVSKTMLLMMSEKSSSLFYNGSQLQASSSGLIAFSSLKTSQLVSASGEVSLRLISPGLVVELIPENQFFACFLLQFSWGSGRAVVIAETDSKDDVHTNNDLLSAAQWTEIPGTKYSSTVVTMLNSATIWHPSSKIAVYMLEGIGNVMYGGPAIPICKKTDLHGCLVAPGVFEIGPDPLNWMQSREYCMENMDQFACPVNQDTQMLMADGLNPGSDLGQSWIGLRRSLLTTDWYWQDEYQPPSPFSYVNWDGGHPLEPQKALCASVSLDNQSDFRWHSARCCELKKPVCYRRPKYLITAQDTSDFLYFIQL
ncbi:hypothetical protein DNTS_020343 [Danionella cerebrum]|uniref:C-type lectin domain-containing protein n=1 Tax=Danionella cerebrum TaxID=2873325 RepID=A0A553MUS3_9TELE|nr:hypothetical protein DNTS_020343 [Danionella translucida]